MDNKIANLSKQINELNQIICNSIINKNNKQSKDFFNWYNAMIKSGFTPLNLNNYIKDRTLAQRFEQTKTKFNKICTNLSNDILSNQDVFDVQYVQYGTEFVTDKYDLRTFFSKNIITTHGLRITTWPITYLDQDKTAITFDVCNDIFQVTFRTDVNSLSIKSTQFITDYGSFFLEYSLFKLSPSSNSTTVTVYDVDFTNEQFKLIERKLTLPFVTYGIDYNFFPSINRMHIADLPFNVYNDIFLTYLDHSVAKLCDTLIGNCTIPPYGNFSKTTPSMISAVSGFSSYFSLDNLATVSLTSGKTTYECDVSQIVIDPLFPTISGTYSDGKVPRIDFSDNINLAIRGYVSMMNDSAGQQIGNSLGYINCTSKTSINFKNSKNGYGNLPTDSYSYNGGSEIYTFTVKSTRGSEMEMSSGQVVISSTLNTLTWKELTSLDINNLNENSDKCYMLSTIQDSAHLSPSSSYKTRISYVGLSSTDTNSKIALKAEASISRKLHVDILSYDVLPYGMQDSSIQISYILNGDTKNITVPLHPTTFEDVDGIKNGIGYKSDDIDIDTITGCLYQTYTPTVNSTPRFLAYNGNKFDNLKSRGNEPFDDYNFIRYTDDTLQSCATNSGMSVGKDNSWDYAGTIYHPVVTCDGFLDVKGQYNIFEPLPESIIYSSEFGKYNTAWLSRGYGYIDEGKYRPNVREVRSKYISRIPNKIECFFNEPLALPDSSTTDVKIIWDGKFDVGKITAANALKISGIAKFTIDEICLPSGYSNLIDIWSLSKSNSNTISVLLLSNRVIWNNLENLDSRINDLTKTVSQLIASCTSNRSSGLSLFLDVITMAGTLLSIWFPVVGIALLLSSSLIGGVYNLCSGDYEMAMQDFCNIGAILYSCDGTLNDQLKNKLSGSKFSFANASDWLKDVYSQFGNRIQSYCLRAKGYSILQESDVAYEFIEMTNLEDMRLNYNPYFIEFENPLYNESHAITVKKGVSKRTLRDDHVPTKDIASFDLILHTIKVFSNKLLSGVFKVEWKFSFNVTDKQASLTSTKWYKMNKQIGQRIEWNDVDVDTEIESDILFKLGYKYTSSETFSFLANSLLCGYYMGKQTSLTNRVIEIRDSYISSVMEIDNVDLLYGPVLSVSSKKLSTKTKNLLSRSKNVSKIDDYKTLSQRISVANVMMDLHNFDQTQVNRNQGMLNHAYNNLKNKQLLNTLFC